MHNAVLAEYEKIAAANFAQAAELAAEGMKRADMIKAEGKKQSKILAAKGEAKIIETICHASRNYFTGDDQLLRILEAALSDGTDDNQTGQAHARPSDALYLKATEDSE